jgi:hypothetical protein
MLFHFTDSRNISSIKEYGLLSWQQLVSKKILHIPCSNELSRELDRRYFLENYVRLCVQKFHPMANVALNEGRVEYLIWLEIDQCVLNWNGTLFSPNNATSNSCILYTSTDVAQILKEPLGYESLLTAQSEFLVEGSIPPQYIKFL